MNFKLKSKIVAFVAFLTLIGANVSALAATTPVSEIYEPTNIINVTGKVDDNYDDVVNLLLVDDESDEVVHIQEVLPEADGSYRAKFKFIGNIDDCTLKVNQNGIDATDTVTQSISYEDTMSYDLTATRNVTANAFLDMENYFNVEDQTYTILMASYDKDGRFKSLEKSDTKTMGINSTNDSFSIEMKAGVDCVKVFVWDDLNNIVPLCNVKTLKKSVINILCIGNSFTDNPTSQLAQIAAADGVTINMMRCMKGGGTLQDHWEAWQTDEAIYDYSYPAGKISDAFDEGQVYDYIIFQQVSYLSGNIDSYSPYAENMVKYLRERQPNAEIVLQEIWSYEQGKSSDSEADYEKIHNAYAHWSEELAKLTTDSGLPISLNGEPLRVIPSGRAVQNARENALFKTTHSGVNGAASVEGSLNSDGSHLSDAYGCYLAGLTWYGCLTGNDVTESKYENKYPISDEAKAILQEASKAAIDENGKW